MRHLGIGIAIISCTALGGCSADITGEGDGLGRTNVDSASLSLVSSTGEIGILRRGEALRAEALDLALAPDTIYRAEVLGPSDALISSTELLTNDRGGILLATLAHDIGEDGMGSPGQMLAIRIMDRDTNEVQIETEIALDAPPPLQVPGWNVTETMPPHIFAADASGAPHNAFAVGGLDPGEIGGAVHVAGEGFPMESAGREVDVYVVKDADEWRGQALPGPGHESYIAGPIAAHVNMDGTLTPTEVFTPGVGNVGIYDILVDVDRDGRFEWSFGVKDGADGLMKVGFTIQYSAAFLRERLSRHILVNIAYDSHHRDGWWRNDYLSTEPVFLYLNPPVMHQYHFTVTKWIVRHQDFTGFWNNPAMADSDGAVPFEHLSTTSMAIRTETGCTNSDPTCFGVMEISGDSESFDVVFDRNGDGRYMPGEDLLDVMSFGEDGELIDPNVLITHPPEEQVGFTVRR